MSTKEKITEKKQFRELSDDELEKVTGGFNLEEEQCHPKTSYEGGVCPSSYADKGDECCYGGVSMKYATMNIEKGFQAVHR